MNLSIKPVSTSTLPFLYRLIKQMAFEEGQGDLFTASYEQFSHAFLCDHPLVFGHLIYHKDEPIGFIVHQKKFATYIGRKVFYIEDLYLGQYQHDIDVFRWLLKEIEHHTKNAGYCRIEIRRLEHHSPPVDPLFSANYHPIDKWKVWRKSLV